MSGSCLCAGWHLCSWIDWKAVEDVIHPGGEIHNYTYSDLWTQFLSQQAEMMALVPESAEVNYWPTERKIIRLSVQCDVFFNSGYVWNAILAPFLQCLSIHSVYMLYMYKTLPKSAVNNWIIKYGIKHLLPHMAHFFLFFLFLKKIIFQI